MDIKKVLELIRDDYAERRDILADCTLRDAMELNRQCINRTLEKIEAIEAAERAKYIQGL